MTAFDVAFKNGKVTFISDHVVWNAYTKDDLDQENQITKQQWLDFVDEYGHGIAESISDIVHDTYSRYLQENKLGDYTDEDGENEND